MCQKTFPILGVVITESGAIVCKTCEQIRQVNPVPNVPPPSARLNSGSPANL